MTSIKPHKWYIEKGGKTLFLKKKQPEKRQKTFEEMLNSELLEVIFSNPKSILEIPEKRLIRYFEEELDVGNLLELFQKLDFEKQKYFLKRISDKKMKYMIKFAVKFHNVSFWEEFRNFLFKLKMDKNKAVFRKLSNLMSNGDEEVISIFFDIFYEMEEEEFLEFYKNSSKIVRIEILEKIFANSSNVVINCLLQSHARFALEELRKEISFTEQLYLFYFNKE